MVTFFNRFDFILSFRPGSKNLKPDALSRVYANVSREDAPCHLFPQPESLPQCVGLGDHGTSSPNTRTRSWEEAQRTVCTSLSLFELRFSSGLTRPRFPAILGSHAHLSFCEGAFGGLQLKRTLQPLSKPAPCAIRTRRHTFSLKVSYTPACPSSSLVTSLT